MFLFTKLNLKQPKGVSKDDYIKQLEDSVYKLIQEGMKLAVTATNLEVDKHRLEHELGFVGQGIFLAHQN